MQKYRILDFSLAKIEKNGILKWGLEEFDGDIDAIEFGDVIRISSSSYKIPGYGDLYINADG